MAKLNEKDVKAIAVDSRRFLPKNLRRQIAVTGYLLLGVIAGLVAVFVYLQSSQAPGEILPASEKLLLATLLPTAGIIGLMVYESFKTRKLRRAFIQHWRETGEVPDWGQE